MFIGLISDTHGVLRSGIQSFLDPVDAVWHAGDFGGGLGFADSIAAFKPLVGVCGNCDGLDIRRQYPQHQYFEIQSLRVLMTHIGGSPGHYDLRAQALIDSYHPDIFICGHVHVNVLEKRGNTVFLNPGSPSLSKREDGRQTCAVIENDVIRIFDIDSGEVVMELDL